MKDAEEKPSDSDSPIRWSAERWIETRDLSFGSWAPSGQIRARVQCQDQSIHQRCFAHLSDVSRAVRAEFERVLAVQVTRHESPRYVSTLEAWLALANPRQGDKAQRLVGALRSVGSASKSSSASGSE